MWIMGITISATADLVFDIDGILYPSGSTVPISGQTTVGLYNDTLLEHPSVSPGSQWPAYKIQWIEVDLGTEVPDSGTVNNDVLPGTWEISDYGASGGYYYWYIEWLVPNTAETSVGHMYSVDVDESTTLTVRDWDFAVIGTINLVPEPATVGLLALGGLSMFRRKKGY